MRSQPMNAVRQQQIEQRSSQVNRPVIEDHRQSRTQSVQASTVPIRTVLFVEVSELANEQVLLLLASLNQQYDENKHGPHYIIPMRNGAIGTDVQFEDEFLKTVNKVCEVKDGRIALRDGAKEVTIIRQTV